VSVSSSFCGRLHDDLRMKWAIIVQEELLYMVCVCVWKSGSVVVWIFCLFYTTSRW